MSKTGGICDGGGGDASVTSTHPINNKSDCANIHSILSKHIFAMHFYTPRWLRCSFIFP